MHLASPLTDCLCGVGNPKVVERVTRLNRRYVLNRRFVTVEDAKREKGDN